MWAYRHFLSRNPIPQGPSIEVRPPFCQGDCSANFNIDKDLEISPESEEREDRQPRLGSSHYLKAV